MRFDDEFDEEYDDALEYEDFDYNTSKFGDMKDKDELGDVFDPMDIKSTFDCCSFGKRNGRRGWGGYGSPKG
jgi:hypothetical protein